MGASSLFRIPLEIVFYKDGETWIAHSLDFDLMGDGESKESALKLLCEAIDIQLAYSIEKNDPRLLFKRAPQEYQDMFYAGDDIAEGQLFVSIETLESASDRYRIESPRLREFSQRPASSDYLCAN